ncbi:hypothetical protein [Bradyrhizobium sp. SZCCHNG3015]|uniref:hypothetical protein n=1 Tax=unclassified Bradyrhizobium TaxID=2631580 RepID=UPI0039655F13
MDGVADEDQPNHYWMMYVDGENAPVGAGEAIRSCWKTTQKLTFLSNGDIATFRTPRTSGDAKVRGTTLDRL